MERDSTTWEDQLTPLEKLEEMILVLMAHRHPYLDMFNFKSDDDVACADDDVGWYGCGTAACLLGHYCSYIGDWTLLQDHILRLEHFGVSDRMENRLFGLWQSGDLEKCLDRVHQVMELKEGDSHDRPS